MNLPTLIGLSGISLLLAAILFRILRYFNISKQNAYLACGVLFILSFVPLSGYTINQYLRGLFNDLSLTSMILLGYYLVKPEDWRQQNHFFLVIIALTGLLFYPAAGGLSPLDPYAWGYLNRDHGLPSPLLFLTVLSLLMMLAFIRQQGLMLLSLVLATIAFQLDWLESNNLWDYLLDPLLFFYALTMTTSRWLLRIDLRKQHR